MTVYNYDNIAFEVSGMSTINTERQQGLLIHLRPLHPKECNMQGKKLVLFIDKRSCAHIAKMTKVSRKFWKRFRLPKMVKQK